MTIAFVEFVFFKSDGNLEILKKEDVGHIYYENIKWIMDSAYGRFTIDDIDDVSKQLRAPSFSEDAQLTSCPYCGAPVS